MYHWWFIDTEIEIETQRVSIFKSLNSLFFGRDFAIIQIEKKDRFLPEYSRKNKGKFNSTITDLNC